MAPAKTIPADGTRRGPRDGPDAAPSTTPRRARKSLGQNFLVDGGVRSRIVSAAELTAEDTVVEVGPGRGFLTRALAERAGPVVAVELDEALAAALEGKALPGVRVVCADAREIPIESLVDDSAPYKLVANLPYYAASPIVRRFLEARRKPELMVVMVQREVAQTMTAKQGKMGLLSVATQVYGRPRVVCHVPPRAFRPAPKVWSSVVRIDVYDAPVVPFDSPQGFFEVVRAGFSAPRKQIRNSLANGLGITAGLSESVLGKAGIDPSRRAQTLTVAEWGQLYDAWRAGGRRS